MKKQELLYKILDELKPPGLNTDRIYDLGDWSDYDTTIPVVQIALDDILDNEVSQ